MIVGILASDAFITAPVRRGGFFGTNNEYVNALTYQVLDICHLFFD